MGAICGTNGKEEKCIFFSEKSEERDHCKYQEQMEVEYEKYPYKNNSGKCVVGTSGSGRVLQRKLRTER